MVQTRSTPIGEGDVVHAPLALHPGCPQATGIIVLGVLGHAKPDVVVEGNGFVHVRAEAIEVIDAQRLDALVQGVLLMNRFEALHARIKFEWYAVWVTGDEGARLVRAFHPLDRQALRPKVRCCLIQMRFIKHLEGKRSGAWCVPVTQYQTMMPTLFHRSQVDH